MKKLFVIGALLLSSLTLTACSNKNSAAAKNSFIDATVEMNDQAYNSHDVNFKVEKFSATGTSAAETNKYLKDAQLGMTVTLDQTNHLAQISGSLSAVGKSYGLNLLMSQKGMYVDSSDIKKIYNDNKTALPTDAKAALPIFDAMIGELSTPYFLIDAQTIDSGLTSSDENWSKTLNDLFTTKQPTKDEVTKSFDSIDNSSFTQKGDEITLKISGKDKNFKTLLKNLASVNHSIPSEQIDEIFKTGSADLKNLNLSMTVNSKKHTMNATVDGKTTDKTSSADFKFNITSQSKKVKNSLTEPSATETKSIADLQQAVVESMTNQALAGSY